MAPKDPDSVRTMCGIDVFYKGSKAYAMTPAPGYSFSSRYSPGKTKAGNAEALDGCTYELSYGWYGDQECAFLVQP